MELDSSSAEICPLLNGLKQGAGLKPNNPRRAFEQQSEKRTEPKQSTGKVFRDESGICIDGDDGENSVWGRCNEI